MVPNSLMNPAGSFSAPSSPCEVTPRSSRGRLWPDVPRTAKEAPRSAISVRVRTPCMLRPRSELKSGRNRGRLNHARWPYNPPQDTSLAGMVRLMKDERRQQTPHRLVRVAGWTDRGWPVHRFAGHRVQAIHQRLLQGLEPALQLVEVDRGIGPELFSAVIVVRVELLVGKHWLLANQAERPVPRPGQMPKHPVKTAATGLRVDQALLVGHSAQILLQNIAAEPELIGDRLGVHRLDFLLPGGRHLLLALPR